MVCMYQGTKVSVWIKPVIQDKVDVVFESIQNVTINNCNASLHWNPAPCTLG